MKNLTRKSLWFALLVAVVLSGCKSDEFVTNSLIQKRKHLKGYHLKSITANKAKFEKVAEESSEVKTKEQKPPKIEKFPSRREVIEEGKNKKLVNQFIKLAKEENEVEVSGLAINPKGNTSSSDLMIGVNPKQPNSLVKLKKPSKVAATSKLSPDDSAILGVVAGYLGVLFLVAVWTAPLSIIFGIVGLIFSIRGLKGEEFKTLAILGLVGSILAILIGIGFTALLVFAILTF